jgi:N-acetylglucosaminyldiphosphoundecaprenol N-acetyl-beta-D-mannosaminyltransferase
MSSGHSRASRAVLVGNERPSRNSVIIRLVSQASRVQILELPLDLVDLEQTLGVIEGWARDETSKRTVITLNPEIVVQAQSDSQMKQSIQNADLVTADGVGIVWAAKRFGVDTPRALGVEIVQGLLKRGGSSLRVFFLGAAPGVAQRAAERCAKEFGVQIAGVRDGSWGYNWNPNDSSTDHVAQAIAEEVRASRADILLTALGAVKQEVFNERYRSARVSLGIGGAVDVLAGHVERAPAWTSRLGVEWAWRIIKLKRWQRAKRLLEFVMLVLRSRK